MKSSKEKGNQGQALVNKKRSHENASRISKMIIGGDGKDGKSCESSHEMHLLTLREGRRKVSKLFADLQALLPRLPSKVNQTTIVKEAVDYIKNLEETLDKLEKQKQERLQFNSTFGCESFVINPHCHPHNYRETFIVDHGSSSSLAHEMVRPNPSKLTSALVPQQPIAFQTQSSPNVILNICGNEAQFRICATRKPGQLTMVAFVLEKYKIEVISANILCNGDGNGFMILAHTNIASSHQFPNATPVEETYKQAAEEIRLLIS